MKHPDHLETADQETRDSVSRLLTGLDRGELSRREFVVRSTALGISLSSVGMLLAACGKAAENAPAKVWDKTMPKELLIYNWNDYTSPKVLRSFEEKYGVKCTVSAFDGNEQMYAKMDSGGVYDVIFPSDGWVSYLAQNTLVQPLDMELLPNFQYVLQPSFVKPSFDDESDGHKYSVPYMFGSAGICANLKKVKDPGTSWSILWDETYEQEIVMLNVPRDVVGVALMLDGHSPYSSDPAEIEAAAQRLIEQKPLVNEYNSDEVKASLDAGMALIHTWDGQAVWALQQGVSQDDLSYILPDEGYIAWADGVCIPSTAPSPYAAHLFLDYLMDPKIAGESATYTCYQPVVDEAMLYVKDVNQQHMRPDAETIANGLVAADVNGTEKLFAEVWKRVMKA